jgi:large subunit ribosomal protein L20
MPRVKRGIQTKKTHKNLLAQAKGYRHGRKKLVKRAREAVIKAGQHAYAHRRTKKRDFRALWIVQINAACRANDLTYSKFMAGLKAKKIELDRKVLADIAENNPEEFTKLVTKVK